jgi:hypothetical protein
MQPPHLRADALHRTGLWISASQDDLIGEATLPLSMLMDQELHRFIIRFDPPSELPDPVKSEAAVAVKSEASYNDGEAKGPGDLAARRKRFSLLAKGKHGAIEIQLAYSER